MSIEKDFEEIIKYAHLWNWSPDWNLVKDIYFNNPDSYSVLTPFAYSYLEEMIRTTTSEYSQPLFHNDELVRLQVGMGLIKLAKTENDDNIEYVRLLDKIKYHYDVRRIYDGNKRNYVLHGHRSPRFWSKEDFENLLHEIALLSPYSKF